MDKKLARKWVDALRSGKYKQGRNSLVKDGKYCCLGVLCELLPGGISLHGHDNSGLREGTVRQLGLRSPLGLLTESRVSLSELNDTGAHIDYLNYTKPLTFDEIADVIQIEYISRVYNG